MISPELAKAVFGHSSSVISSDGDIICIMMDIHRVAHECKLWAYKQKLDFSFYISVCTGLKYDSTFIVPLTDQFRPVTFTADSELESIFLVCQYILENRITL